MSSICIIYRQQLNYNQTVTVEPAIRTKKHGTEFGLMVVLNQMMDDYAYAMHSNVGSRIMVSETSSFPDHISGSIKQRFLSVGEEMFATLWPRIVDGSGEMRPYNKLTRNCAFPDEISLIYQKYSVNIIFTLIFKIYSRCL